MEADDDQNILISTEIPKRSLRDYRLEPALLVLFFGFNLSSAIVPNILLKETCLHDGFNAANCSELSDNNGTKDIEELIQPKVAEMMMTLNLMHAIIPAIMSLFFGPWTDKYGRKKIIVATSIGFTVNVMSLYVISMLSQRMILNPWIFVLPAIPAIITGGWPSMVLAILCYVTDITNESNRSARLMIIEMILFLGVILGNLFSSYILSLTSETTVFIIGFTCCFIATLHITFFVNESVQNIEEASMGKKICDLISPTPVIDIMKTCFRKRSFKERRILWGLIIILIFSVFTMNGVSTVSYLFVREKFQWTLSDATLFDSISYTISIIGCILGITLFKRILKISDMTLIFVALISAILDSLIKAFAQTPAMMYVASGVALFKIMGTPMCRSVVSSIIPNSEIGKVYSCTSAFEAVSSLVAAPLFTYVYSRTFTFFAGAFYLISTTVFVINFIIAICVHRMRQKRDDLINPYGQIEN